MPFTIEQTLHPAQYKKLFADGPAMLELVSQCEAGGTTRDAQPALVVVIGRHYITERDSAPEQYNGVLV